MSKNQSTIQELLSSLSFAPDNDHVYLVKDQRVLIKTRENALTDKETKEEIVSQIALLSLLGEKTVVVHGGGIEIKQLLDDVE